jgi:hypothetical protein
MEDIVELDNLEISLPTTSAQTTSLASFITPKVKKRKIGDTFTYSTTTPIPPVQADVDSSEDSESNEEDLGTILSSITSTPKSTGLDGLSITYKNPDGLYTRKSQTWISAEYFLDIKIYKNVGVLETT